MKVFFSALAIGTLYLPMAGIAKGKSDRGLPMAGFEVDSTGAANLGASVVSRRHEQALLLLAQRRAKFLCLPSCMDQFGR